MKKNCLINIVTCLVASAVTAQTTVIIPASADNTIYQNPNGNSNALGQNIFSGTNGGGSPRRGLIKFDIAGALPGGVTVTSVSLTLNCNSSRSISDNVSLHRLSSNWGEGTSNAGSTGDGGGVPATANDATWLNTFFPASFWTNPGGDYNPVPSASTSINVTGFYSWSTPDMVTDVQAWINTPGVNYGWILLCNETTISTARKFGSKENTVIANRPSLSVTYSTTLPVLLTDFTARKISTGVLLNWETTQEINNRFFEILYSPNGVLFSSIGRVNGQGTSSERHAYQFIHDMKVPGNHFYKLAQEDYDGNKTQSRAEKVYIPEASVIMEVVPNPVLNEFKVSSNINVQNTSYSIFDQRGVMVLTGLLSPDNIKSETLRPGIYYLCVYKDKKQISCKAFIKM
jgi:Secretion system C-terminal sorting domain